MSFTVLREELLRRYREERITARERPEQLVALHENNAAFLWSVIHSHRWPTAAMVGKEGEEAAWLLAQNSTDTILKQECLSQLSALPQTFERREFQAYLTDAILVEQNLPQRYGTQCKNGEPLPVEHPDLLQVRRKEMNLCTIEEYQTIMAFHSSQ